MEQWACRPRPLMPPIYGMSVKGQSGSRWDSAVGWDRLVYGTVARMQSPLGQKQAIPNVGGIPEPPARVDTRVAGQLWWLAGHIMLDHDRMTADCSLLGITCVPLLGHFACTSLYPVANAPAGRLPPKTTARLRPWQRLSVELSNQLQVVVLICSVGTAGTSHC